MNKMTTLYTDGDWMLVRVGQRRKYKLRHPCGAGVAYRYNLKDFPSPSINTPCGWCNSRCPQNLQGLYLALTEL